MKIKELLLLTLLCISPVSLCCSSHPAKDDVIEKPEQGVQDPDKPGNDDENKPDPEEGPAEVAAPDTWAAVDELGRATPSDAPNKNDRQVLMFYWTWHTQGMAGDYASVINISEVLRDHPEAMSDFNHPAWGVKSQQYFWGKPLLDYYRTTDTWVLRKHAEMLADAGVDAVFFDCTNRLRIYEDATEALMETWTKAQEDGVNAPKIGFILGFSPSNEDSYSKLRTLYNTIYKDHRYENLWYKLNGKPVIMAYYDMLGKTGEDAVIRDFFTFRPCFSGYKAASHENRWIWMQCYPQAPFNNGELMSVSVAQNTSVAYNYKPCAFNSPGTFGRSYTATYGWDQSENSFLRGANFQEQWDRALSYNPKIVFVTGWNEWIASKWENYPSDNPYKPFSFVDEFDWEHSRDIEPTAEWGDYGDCYYYQLVQNVRRYKGVHKYPRVSKQKTIEIGSFSGWENVSPDFKHYGGNTMHRNHIQHSSSGIVYTNDTGRNDFVDAKVARDDANIYFYVETAEDITPRTDPKWMRLFINSDRDINTGWKGYDYILNYSTPLSDTEGFVSKCVGNEWKWSTTGVFSYAIKGNKMEIRVAKSALGLEGKLNFEFKWSDNMQDEGNILDFYVNGDAAPGGRFNFVYTEP